MRCPPRVAKVQARPLNSVICADLPSSATSKALKRTLGQTLFIGSLESPSKEHQR